MERLTERGEFGNSDIIGVDSADLQLNLDFDAFNRVTDALNRLAAYEDTGLEPEEVKEITSWSYGPFHKKMGDWLKAEHEGRLVVLPCKVGDTVYRVWPYRKPIITEHKMHDLTEIAKYIDAFGVTFGKTVFLTREEAEAALKGVSEDA